MGKTALELTLHELKQYKPFSRLLKRRPNAQRLQSAWAVAKEASRILYEKFSADKVVVFGSLVDSTMFTQWSDIDIAVAGISAKLYL